MLKKVTGLALIFLCGSFVHANDFISVEHSDAEVMKKVAPLLKLKNYPAHHKAHYASYVLDKKLHVETEKIFLLFSDYFRRYSPVNRWFVSAPMRRGEVIFDTVQSGKILNEESWSKQFIENNMKFIKSKIQHHPRTYSNTSYPSALSRFSEFLGRKEGTCAEITSFEEFDATSLDEICYVLKANRFQLNPELHEANYWHHDDVNYFKKMDLDLEKIAYCELISDESLPSRIMAGCIF
jgi:hypothetical protein